MGESPKVEARLGLLMQTALGLYMQDRHLQNESEVLRSALGKFLDDEGYLAKAARALGLRAEESHHSETMPNKNKKNVRPVGYTKGSKKQSKTRS